jgi:hypothetical protein
MATTGAWQELFGGGRKWRVAEEVSGEVPVGPWRVTFARGRFELPAGAAYRSLLSTNLGRRGVLLTETSPDGVTDIPGSRIAVGEPALKRAREEFSAVW